MAARQGSKHHGAKLTPAIVRAARKAYADRNAEIVVLDKETGKRKRVKANANNLARKYGVSGQTMLSAIKGETWGHVQ